MSFYNINILFLFFLHMIQFSTINSYIILNFKKFINESLSQTDTALNLTNLDETRQFLFSNYITYLEIGNPLQKVELNLFSNDYGLKIYEKNCFTNFTFLPKLSNSFEEVIDDPYDYDYDYSNIAFQVKVTDLINFITYYNNMKYRNNYTVNFSFVYEKSNMNISSIKKSNERPCLHFGMYFKCSVNDYFCVNLMKNLKDNKIIDSYNVNIIFNENKNQNYDGSIIIGTNSNITLYNDLFKNTKLVEDYSSHRINVNLFEIQFDEVYYYKNEEKIKGNLYSKDRAQFLFDFNYIIGTNYYYKSIKEEYFDKHQENCSENIIMDKYMIFVCDKSFNTDDFPTLYFYNNDYNYTFKFTSKDLFITKGNKKYFIVIINPLSIDIWQIGKIFMEKNYFNFNFNTKKVGLYKPMKIENKNVNNFNFGKSFYLIIYILSLVIIGSLCFYLGARYYNKIRKRRKNELEDLIEDEDNFDSSK